jgi:hypothetical protein
MDWHCASPKRNTFNDVSTSYAEENISLSGIGPIMEILINVCICRMVEEGAEPGDRARKIDKKMVEGGIKNTSKFAIKAGQLPAQLPIS